MQIIRFGALTPSALAAGLLSRRLLMTRVEFPVPALIVVDLHVVVCRVLCPVTCAACWAALCTGESNPRAARRAPEKWPDFPPAPGCARLRDDYLLHLAARYSMRSNSQLDCWMRTSSSRICRARSSACARSCATGRAASILSSERS